jgi:hypothetical protein
MRGSCKLSLTRGSASTALMIGLHRNLTSALRTHQLLNILHTSGCLLQAQLVQLGLPLRLGHSTTTQSVQAHGWVERASKHAPSLLLQSFGSGSLATQRGLQLPRIPCLVAVERPVTALATSVTQSPKTQRDAGKYPRPQKTYRWIRLEGTTAFALDGFRGRR